MVFILAGAATLQPAGASAEDGDGGWEWRATIYGWLPDLEATARFPTGGEGTINVDTATLLDNLDFTFMGALEVRKGSWGMFTDVLYLDEGASRSGIREVDIGRNDLPADVTADVVFDLKSWVWTLAGTYNLMGGSENPVDLAFGARMVDMDQSLAWSFNGDISQLPLPGPEGSSDISQTNWDAVIGLKGHTSFGTEGRWVLPWYFDIGTGDSDFTWQAMAGLGYQFGWGAVVLTYRYLDYDLDSDSAIADMTFSGPMIGASFTW
jgi:hypothetical protein